MWKCVRCNKENQDSAEKCINCGHGKTMDYTGHRSVSRLRPEMTNNWKKKKEKSMLMAGYMGNDKAVFGSKLLRKEVCKIDFVKMNLASIPSGAWDVSKDQDRTIWAWKRETPEGYTLYIGSEKGVYANKDCDYLFCDYLNVKKINFNNLFDTSHVTNMCHMFSECESLEELDVSGFDTGSVEDMGAMFKDCENLKSLDVSGFDTGNVKNMWAMFRSCKNLKSLDVSGFDTGSVESMQFMFSECEALSELDVSGFDTRNVIDMGYMFYDCKNLEKLDVGEFNTSRVTDMKSMFSGCKKLKSLDVSNFDTRSVENMYNMFNGCEKLERLDVSGFDTSRVTDMYGMFYECRKLERLDVDSFNTELVKDMGFMFCKCERLTEINVSHFKTDQVENMEAMFNGCYNLRKLDVSGFDTRKATNMKNMFSFCENLTQLDTSNFYYAPNVNVEGMFKECGVNKVQTEHNTPDFQSTSQELTVLNPDELEKLSCGSYKGNSIEELCKDFLTDSLNAQINNAGANSKWIINALEIPPEDKIYILRDEGSSFVKFSSVGFAITDRGIYMKYALSRKVIKTPWEKFMKARTIKRAARTLETDLGEIAIYSGESGSAMAKWYELGLCRLEMLFICIHKLLNANAS